MQRWTPHVLRGLPIRVSGLPPRQRRRPPRRTGAAGRGIKVLFVTHDQGQARRVADDVVFMHAGSVVEHAAAGAFFERPASETARAYLDGRLVLP